MRSDLLKGAIVGAVSAVLVLSTATALAGTGVGKVFNLGKVNSVNKSSYLAGSTSSRMLSITNNGSGPALGLYVKPGQAPLTVNSAVKVNSLNADTVDGIDSANLMQGAGSVVNARVTEPLNSGNGVLLTVPHFGTVEVSTGAGGVPNYRLFWRNGLSGATTDVWYSNGATTTYTTLAPGTGLYFAPVDGDADAIYTIRSGYPGHTATIVVSAHAGASGGVYYAQATVQ